jgi:glycosyl transferase family 87
VVLVPLRAEFLDNDLTLVYMAARIGLEHGWSHIYSLPLQHQVFSELRPHAAWHSGAWFLATPPYAWLLAPMVPLGAGTSVASWMAVALVSLVAAWWIAAPGAGWTRTLWLLGALAWYPVLYALSLVQPDFLVVLLVAGAWKLAERERPYLAGAVLGLTAIKPQLVLLLPLVLVTSGRWRIALTWAAVAGTLGLLALVSLGPDGLGDYRSILGQAQSIANNRYFTPAYVLGAGPPGYIFSAAVILLAAGAGYLNRGASNARVFALGLVATTIGATYWHLQDFAVLVLAAWLFWRDAPPVWQRAWLLVVVAGGEFAWGLTPLPVLVGVAAWFACLVVPSRIQRVAA